jgi:hypothetical protein
MKIQSRIAISRKHPMFDPVVHAKACPMNANVKDASIHSSKLETFSLQSREGSPSSQQQYPNKQASNDEMQ